MTAKLVREKLIQVAPGLIETADKLARGELPDYAGDRAVLQAMLRLVSPVIDLRDDHVQIETRKEMTVEERVQAVMDAVESGVATIEQGRLWIDGLAKANDILDSKALLASLEKLANAT